ncbi:MAG: DUF4230 domain-containing protein [Lachnospiraceae bacterium]|nr:DUF4230 domain-containing protein [Lachnospiraceae bacterium]
MKKMIKLAGPVILVVLMIVAAFYVSNRLERNTSVSKQENTFTQTEKVITGDIIKAGLADIGELATEEYYYTGVESFDSSKSYKGFNIPLTTTRFIYSYDGVIKAGIDFTAIEVEKDDLKKLIVVKLPKSKILSSEIDENSFKLYDEKQSIFNPLSVSDVNDTIKDLKAKAEADAEKKGVLERADKNAVKMIKQLLVSTYDLSDYTIKVETEN